MRKHLGAVLGSVRRAAVARLVRNAIAIQIISLAGMGAILAGGAVGVVVVDSARTALRDDVLRGSLTNAQFAAALTANYLKQTLNPALGFVDRRSVRSLATPMGLAELTPDLERWLTRNTNAENASLYDLTGLNRATGLADKSVIGRVSIADRPYFKAAVATGTPQQGPAVISRTTGRPTLPNSIPILNEGGEVVGVFEVGISLSELSQTLAGANLGINARTSLVDLERGVYLVPPDTSSVLQAVSTGDAAVQHLLARESGTLETTTEDGTDVLAAFAPVPDKPWGILIEQPSVDAFAPVQATVQRSTRAVILLVLLTAALGAGLATHISRPVRDLRRAAEAMANGQLDQRVALSRRDEFGELGRAFNGMADRLQMTVTELEESLGRMRAIMESVAEGILTVNARGRVASCNIAAERMFGYSAAELIGLPMTNLLGQDSHRVLTSITCSTAADPIADNQGSTPETTGVHKDGSTFPLELSLSITQVDGERRLIAVVRDITDRKRFEEDLTRLAFRDSLTGLANRSLFLERVEHALERAERRRTPVSVLFLDLDNFKIVNDSLGHQRGDALLVETAQRLQGCLRSTDTAARLGGDEFAVLLEGTDVSEAAHVAERIATSLQTPVQLGERQVFVSASVGVAVSMAVGERPDALIRKADVAMYRAKTAGKARYTIFDPGMEIGMLDRLDLETDFRRALEHGEFRVYYQPIVSLSDGRIVGLEALVRWAHPERGLIPPADFIPLAEDTGMIAPLGQLVLEEACRQVRRWQDQFPSDPPLGISINLSARQFQNPTLVQDIDRAWREAKLDPSTLRLEITETVLMRDPEGAQAKLVALTERGIHLAIDDFGTGYSSLSYLKRFPIDTLKIDRCFVAGLGQDSQDAAIVRSVVELAKSLNLQVTGEGVETAAQRAHLQLLGCEHAQGYLFARPLAAEDIGALLSRNSLQPDAQHVA
ncbi:MAG: hypothetical protein NVSMB2_07780 [Chloroflexota bacterium]